MSIVPTTLSTPTLPQNPALISNQFEWQETADAHVLRAEIPGLNKNEMKIELDDQRVLHVTGQRTLEKKDDSEGCHRVERSSCSFKKSFSLPPNAKLDLVKASYENGLLTINIAKANENLKAIENSY